jgi:hypothetical protein
MPPGVDGPRCDPGFFCPSPRTLRAGSDKTEVPLRRLWTTLTFRGHLWTLDRTGVRKEVRHAATPQSGKETRVRLRIEGTLPRRTRHLGGPVARKVVRSWHFWRAAFWTRPALLLLYAAILTPIAVATLLTIPGGFSDARAMENAHVCRSAEDENGCLQAIRGTLDGPWYARGPGSDWFFRELTDGSVEEADKFRASTAASNKLEDLAGATVTGLHFEGQVVAIEGPDGQLVETDEFGHQAWLLRLYIGMFALGGAAMLVNAARLKRSNTDGWWSVRGEGILLMTLASPWMKAACLLAVPSMLGFVPIVVIDSVPGSLAAFVGGLALTVFAIVKASGTSDSRRD